MQQMKSTVKTKGTRAMNMKRHVVFDNRVRNNFCCASSENRTSHCKKTSDHTKGHLHLMSISIDLIIYFPQRKSV